MLSYLTCLPLLGGGKKSWYIIITIDEFEIMFTYRRRTHKLTSFFREICFFLPAAQFAYRKGLRCTDALLTISDQLQKSLVVGLECYIGKLDFSSSFDRVGHSGL